MALVALVVLVSTAAGLSCERAYGGARALSRAILAAMLYVLVPFVSFVKIAHLHVTAGAGVGLVLAYIAIAIAGILAWLIGPGPLGLGPAALGALICCVILVNTGYLGLPMSVALLGTHALSTLQAAMPTAVNSLLVGHAYSLDQRLIATVIVWSPAAVLVLAVIGAALF